MTLAELLDLMHSRRVLRARLADGTEAELHPSAFAPPSADAPDQPDSDSCPGCTHSLEVEHNADGLCLKGCAVETCRQVPQASEVVG